MGHPAPSLPTAEDEWDGECCFPDCGCDGARLCMGKNGANAVACALNIERKSRRTTLNPAAAWQFPKVKAMSQAAAEPKRELSIRDKAEIARFVRVPYEAFERLLGVVEMCGFELHHKLHPDTWSLEDSPSSETTAHIARREDAPPNPATVTTCTAPLIQAHSKTEFKRLSTMGANVLPPDQGASAQNGEFTQAKSSHSPAREGSGSESEAHPPAPPALGTPRTDAEHDRIMSIDLDGAFTPAQNWEGSFIVMADFARTRERELAAANERLNAPVPEIESQVVTFRDADGQFVPADLARDLYWKWRAADIAAAVRLARADAAESALAEAVAKELNGLPYVVQYRRHGATLWRNMAAFDVEGKADSYAKECNEANHAHWEYRAIAAAIRGSSEGGERG